MECDGSDIDRSRIISNISVVDEMPGAMNKNDRLDWVVLVTHLLLLVDVTIVNYVEDYYVYYQQKNCTDELAQAKERLFQRENRTLCFDAIGRMIV